MSLRKRLFGDRKASSAGGEKSTHSTRRSELRDAWAAFDDADFATAITAVRPYLGVADSKVSREARKLVALAEFQQGNYSESMVLFQGLAAVSADAADWFNVITAATLADEVATAEHALLIAIQCQNACGHAQQPSVNYMRYYFGCALCDCGQYDKAFRQLEELRLCYEQLMNTDDDFLISNGMPPLMQCLTLASNVLQKLQETMDVQNWLVSFGVHLDENGKRLLDELRGQFDCRL